MQPKARFTAIAFLAIGTALSAPRAQFYDYISPPRDTISAPGTRLEAKPLPKEPSRAERIGSGVAEMVCGLLLLPVGLIIAVVAADDGCREEYHFGGETEEICSGNGPSLGGTIAGVAIAGGGGYMIIDGLARIGDPDPQGASGFGSLDR